MQTVSDGFKAQATATARSPLDYVEVAWDDSVSVETMLGRGRGGTGWFDETHYLEKHTGLLRLHPPGEELIAPGDVCRATVTLDNRTCRFSWRNSTSTLAAYIGTPVGLTGKLLRIWSGFMVSGTPEYVCIFTGVIVGQNEDTVNAFVEVECRDIGFIYLQNKISTTSYELLQPDAWIATLATLAGIPNDLGSPYDNRWRKFDLGIFRSLWLWCDDESAVEEMWEVARGDGGVCFFDQTGRLVFQNLVHWASQAIAFNFLELSHAAVESSTNLDDVVTKVVCEWSGRGISNATAVYELEKGKIIKPGETLSWECRYANPVKEIFDVEISGASVRDYRAYSDGGLDLSSSLTIAITNSYAQKCTISVTNNHATLSAHLGYLRIRGTPIIGGPTEQVAITASPPPFSFERTRSIRGNMYQQSDDQARALSTYVVERNKRLRPTYTLRDARGIAYLELGDRVTAADTRQFGVTPIDGFVTGIQWRSDDKGFVFEEVQVLDGTALFPATDLYYCGITVLGDGRAWY